MKIFGVVGTTLLLLILGMGVTAFGQDQREDAKPQAQEEERKDEAKPSKPEDKTVKRDEEKRDENSRRQEDRTSKQEESKTVQNDRRGQEHQASRIPDEKFRAHFGREHTFRIGHPTVVEGRSQFSYGGYSFVMVDPWPTGWAYTDMVYVDFIDGVYYLIDPVHPGVQIVVNVAF
jgi:hypothetical protein